MFNKSYSSNNLNQSLKRSNGEKYPHELKINSEEDPIVTLVNHNKLIDVSSSSASDDQDAISQSNEGDNKFEADIHEAMSICLSVNCDPKTVAYNLVEKLYYNIKEVDCKNTGTLKKNLTQIYAKLNNFFEEHKEDVEAATIKAFLEGIIHATNTKDLIDGVDTDILNYDLYNPSICNYCMGSIDSIVGSIECNY